MRGMTDAIQKKIVATKMIQSGRKLMVGKPTIRLLKLF